MQFPYEKFKRPFTTPRVYANALPVFSPDRNISHQLHRQNNYNYPANNYYSAVNRVAYYFVKNSLYIIYTSKPVNKISVKFAIDLWLN